MTHSIIRRFARYHGIDIGHREGAHACGYIAAMLPREGEWTPDQSAECRDRLIQSLTRIEDAELIMKAANPMPTTAWGQGFVTANESAHEGFLRLAGIDPAKWREVKDEEA